jgi:predicted dithiol-disulfide oxidoreductase (DUF899 family)
VDNAPKTMPEIVSEAEWKATLLRLREREKALTRKLDALSAERRRMPMVAVRGDYVFRGPGGDRSLLELFDGRSQLIVYHFMFGADWDAGCPGCSWVVDAMSHSAHLNARDTSLVLSSRADLATLLAYRERMGWDYPWYSSGGSTFNVDMGATVDGDEHHGVSVFLRDKDQVYRTYNTVDRGVEHLGSHWTYLDLLPYGRQEEWEDSPAGWPQTEAYSWHRRHDEY